MRAKSIRLDPKALAALDRLYARLPEIRCRGLCWRSCGAVPMAAAEWDRLVVRVGRVPLPVVVDETGAYCPLLTTARHCKAHDIRPMLCRLYGLVDDGKMHCEFGCVPDRWVTEEEAFELLAAADAVGGGATAAQVALLYPDLAKTEFGA